MASRSVCDIGGKVRWNHLNTGPLNTLRRHCGSATRAAFSANTIQNSASSQPGALLKMPISSTYAAMLPRICKGARRRCVRYAAPITSTTNHNSNIIGPPWNQGLEPSQSA